MNLIEILNKEVSYQEAAYLPISNKVTIKEIKFENSIEQKVELDINITEELKKEGTLR